MHLDVIVHVTMLYQMHPNPRSAEFLCETWHYTWKPLALKGLSFRHTVSYGYRIVGQFYLL